METTLFKPALWQIPHIGSGGETALAEKTETLKQRLHRIVGSHRDARFASSLAAKGENMRVFPISNWTELDIWQYIARENLELPPIYYSHRREVVRRRGLLVPVTPLTPKMPSETSEILDVRFRTVGDISCTCPVESTASTPTEIIRETAVTDISERSATRLDDQASEAAMEKRKKEGYF